MLTAAFVESLGTRIVAAARMAAALHLEMDQKSSPIGGADQRVTDDQREEMMSDE